MVGFVLIATVLSTHEAGLGPRLLYSVGFGAFAVGTLLLTRLTPGDDWAVLLPGLLAARSVTVDPLLWEHDPTPIVAIYGRVIQSLIDG